MLFKVRLKRARCERGNFQRGFDTFLLLDQWLVPEILLAPGILNYLKI